ncbi:alpha/beta hydrolase [Rhodococcus sp. 27YEA15]|uniref:alpha/beta hydrolase n=1 Tax=Rhodococcus sp. 27YEA15 TaxID=3156259 RepID=UPI003C7B6CDD
MHEQHFLTRLSQLSLDHGHAILVLLVGSAVALVGAVLMTRWLAWRATLVAAGLAVLTAVTCAVVVWVRYRPLPLQVPVPSLLWTAVAGFVMVGSVMVLRRRPGLLRGASVIGLAGIAAVVAAGQVNAHTGTFPTAGSLVGHWPLGATETVDFASVPGFDPAPQQGLPTQEHWRAPADIPRHGVLTEVPIPGEVSGFAARPAMVYLPPAYLAEPRAELPVLVLIAGQPGNPADWLDSGKLTRTIDSFASQHSGLAPVVVLPDALGAFDANPGCMDSSLGNVATYLSDDVPTWIETNLQVNPNPAQWAIGGYSYGGTCAIQMAVTHPERYPTFLDFSGQDEPSVGDHATTVSAMFGGDESAFDAVNARDLMLHNSFPQISGIFVAGADDATFRPQQQTMFAAARRAGMNVEYYSLPGGHSGQVWGTAFALEIDWLSRTLDLIR